METDLRETFKLIKGGLLEHRSTWQGYLDSDPPWQKTAGLLTGPIIVVNVVLSVIFAKVVGGFYSYAYGSNFFLAMITGIIMSAIGVTLASWVLAFFAGKFQGRNSFARALAAVSLAMIPGAAAGVVGALIPGLGFLIAMAGGILSLVFLYKILPLALDIPPTKRPVHFIVSLLCLFVLNAVLATLLGIGSAGQQARAVSSSGTQTEGIVTGSGMFGEIQRQTQLAEMAAADSYMPPKNGKLTEKQVQAYLKVKQKTRALHERYAKKMNDLKQDLDDKENPSAADISRVYSGLGSVLGANNAEMEVVKTGDGNWAEHQWIASSLRSAMVQQGDGSDAIEHNFALYEKYREALEE